MEDLEFLINVNHILKYSKNHSKVEEGIKGKTINKSRARKPKEGEKNIYMAYNGYISMLPFQLSECDEK